MELIVYAHCSLQFITTFSAQMNPTLLRHDSDVRLPRPIQQRQLSMVATISRKLNIRRLLAWLGLLFVLGTVAQADEQELATQGKTTFVIVTPANPLPEEVTAADWPISRPWGHSTISPAIVWGSHFSWRTNSIRSARS